MNGHELNFSPETFFTSQEGGGLEILDTQKSIFSQYCFLTAFHTISILLCSSISHGGWETVIYHEIYWSLNVNFYILMLLPQVTFSACVNCLWFSQ